MDMAFHLFGSADCKVFIRPRKKSKLFNELSILIFAVYGLINANLKWKSRYDNSLFT